MATITVLKNNVPTGPFTRTQIAEKLQAGEMHLEDLAFVEGLSQWTPLHDVLAKVDAVAIPPSPPVPGSTPPAYSYAVTMQPPEHLQYAGFWLRVAAIFIDGLIFSPLSVISIVLSFMSRADNNNLNIAMWAVSLAYSLFLLVVRWLYFALMESSSWQATVGKRVMGIQVTGMQGERIGFGRATGRYFGKIISALPLCIGFMMAGFTERKQALHDMIAGTLVVRK